MGVAWEPRFFDRWRDRNPSIDFTRPSFEIVSRLVRVGNRSIPRSSVRYLLTTTSFIAGSRANPRVIPFLFLFFLPFLFSPLFLLEFRCNRRGKSDLERYT